MREPRTKWPATLTGRIPLRLACRLCGVSPRYVMPVMRCKTSPGDGISTGNSTRKPHNPAHGTFMKLPDCASHLDHAQTGRSSQPSRTARVTFPTRLAPALRFRPVSGQSGSYYSVTSRLAVIRPELVRSALTTTPAPCNAPAFPKSTGGPCWRKSHVGSGRFVETGIHVKIASPRQSGSAFSGLE